MGKELLVVGLNHKRAPVGVRERLAFGPERVPPFLRALRAAFAGMGLDQAECVLLSTCNRSEVYACTTNTELAQQVICDQLFAYAKSPGFQALPEQLHSLLYVHQGKEAARHLLRVAAGLDSLVRGENEILGQVRTAHAIAREQGTAGTTLDALFRRAITTGKRVRTETEIGQAGRSVATVVVELAQEELGSLAEHTALLIGAGKISLITARALVACGLRCILVANRTYERALKMAQNLGGGIQARAVRFDALKENLAEADIVICSTSAPHIVLHAEQVAAAMRLRPERPLLVADLAVPHDADPQIAMIPGVQLRTIDDLQALAERGDPLTKEALQAAEAVVAEELHEFQCWLTARQCAPIVRALREKVQGICQEELTACLEKMNGCPEEQRQALEALVQSIAAKILHEPSVQIKQPPDWISPEAWEEMVSRLFGVGESDISQ